MISFGRKILEERGFTNLNRFEFKYHVPLAWIDSIATFLEPWCGLDPFCTRSQDGFYWISNIYLDTPRRTFFKWTDSKPDGRFDMRIRAYGQNPSNQGPFHYEIKEKRRETVAKSRGTLKRGSADRLWNDSLAVMESARDEEDRRNLEEFLRRAISYNATPSILTQYRRMAWFGISEVYARVTVDVDMRWREETGYDFTVDPSSMRRSDIPEYTTPGADAVLELKCDPDAVPDWMMELVLMLNLNRTGYSKFASGTREMLRLPGVRSPIRRAVSD